MGLGFFNATEFTAKDVPFVDAAGREVVVVVVKATFEVTRSGELRRAEEPSPVRLNDVMWNAEDERSSVRLPSDISDSKVGTDVVVVGDAVSSVPVLEMDVAVKVRDATASLRVHGPRFFYKGITGVAVGPAAKVDRVPLQYEKAFGGMSDDLRVVEERNPSGVGVASNVADLVDKPAPQIESPRYPHRSARDHHAPVGLGSIMTHWLPRRSYAGTFDEKWKQTRMPLLPFDFDNRFNNVAHPSMLFADGLKTGDAIAVLGMTLEGVLSFSLPALPVVFHGLYHASGRRTETAPIDTVLIEPGRRRFEITARRVFPIGRAKDVLRELRVDSA